MEERARAALEKSVAKWDHDLWILMQNSGVVLTNNILSREPCELCAEFYNEDTTIFNECCGCPVKNSTKKRYCKGTPYKNVNTLRCHYIVNKKEIDSVLIEAYKAEVEFLKSLLQKE